MNRTIPFAGVLVFLLAHAGWGQAATNPTAGQAKPAPKLANPGTLVRQLMRMSPEQRERALEKLPPRRQAEIRERLQQFDNLPRAEQQRRLQLSEMFANLPPEKQDLVRRQIQAFNQLPDDRRRIVGAAFQRLRRLPASERQARIASQPFRNRFTPAEQQILADLSENLPPPQTEPARP
jgi:hypothetical protein